MFKLFFISFITYFAWSFGVSDILFNQWMKTNKHIFLRRKWTFICRNSCSYIRFIYIFNIKKTPVDSSLFFYPPPPKSFSVKLDRLNVQETILIFNKDFFHIQWNWISILHDILGIVNQTNLIFIWRYLLCLDKIIYSVLNKEEVQSCNAKVW